MRNTRSAHPSRLIDDNTNFVLNTMSLCPTHADAKRTKVSILQDVSKKLREIGAPAAPVVNKAQFQTILAM